MWDIKQKAIHEQTKQTHKQKSLIDTDNRMVVTRAQRAGDRWKGKEGETYMVLEGD